MWASGKLPGNPGKVKPLACNLVEALKWFQDSLAISDRLTNSNPNTPKWRLDVAGSFSRIALVLAQQGDIAGAVTDLRQSRELILQLEKQAPDVAPLLGLYETALAKFEDGLLFVQQNETAAALDAFRQFHEVSRNLSEKSPSDKPLLALFDAGIATLERSLAAEPRKLEREQVTR